MPPEKYLVYNTFSGGIAILDKIEIKKMQSLSGYLTDFKKMGFVVDEDIDEFEIINNDRNINIYSKSSATYRILTTTNCNARCFYCFEKDYIHQTMSIDKAKEVADFIIKHSANMEEIHIQWFGGEPLLNCKVIDYITFEIKKNLLDTKLIFSMITNGSLITNNLIKKMKEEWSISKVQITLDGYFDEYEKRKKYLNQTVDLKSIINAIEELLKNDIYVSIRMNFDNYNINSIIDLITYLSEKFHDYNNWSCYPYPLFGEMCETDKNESLMRIYRKMLYIEGLNQKRINIKYKYSPCIACLMNGLFISPDGKLYKCDMDMENNVGDVQTGVKRNVYFFQWVSDLKEECKECVYLPLCQGGCRAGHLGKSTEKCFLQKSILPELLKLEFFENNNY